MGTLMLRTSYNELIGDNNLEYINKIIKYSSDAFDLRVNNSGDGMILISGTNPKVMCFYTTR